MKATALLLTILVAFQGCATLQDAAEAHRHDLDCHYSDSRAKKVGKSLATIPLAPVFVLGGSGVLAWAIYSAFDPPLSSVVGAPLGLAFGVPVGAFVGAAVYTSSIIFGGMPEFSEDCFP